MTANLIVPPGIAYCRGDSMSIFVLSGILFPFAMTALGASVVFFFSRSIGARAQRICLGFAAGVMAAATAFSLLVPAAEQMANSGGAAWCWLPLSFLVGAALIFALDVFLRRIQAVRRWGEDAQRRLLLLSAVTLHNIPEGMAVGVAFAAAGVNPAAAAAVALGIGLQNLPEGAAVSLPLRQGGMDRGRSVLIGAISGAVEPIAALLVLLFSAALAPVLPLLMAVSAGAMMWVVFAEMLPVSGSGRDGSLAAALGFVLMMALDLLLG